MLLPEALSHIDMQLHHLCHESEFSFGGIALKLASTYWQKLPPPTMSMAGQLVAHEVAGFSDTASPLDPTSMCLRGLHLFRQACGTVISHQMRAAEDPPFQDKLLHLRDTTG